MAKLHRLSIVVLLSLLSLQQTLSVDSPQSAPSPAPKPAADVPPPPPPEARSPASPAPSPKPNSPPAPPPSDLPPGSSPTPSPPPKKSPAPEPAAPSDVSSGKSDVDAGGKEEEESDGGGLKGGQKAGIALGVIAAVCVVALGAILYMKRQQNIQRSQYGYEARREIL